VLQGDLAKPDADICRRPHTAAHGVHFLLCPASAAFMVKLLKPDPASPVACTERLLLQRWALDEAGSWFELNADPELIRFTGDSAFPSVDAVLSCVPGLEHEAVHELAGV
jgi:hypothetical protein